MTECIRTASCESGDHTYTWPCVYTTYSYRAPSGCLVTSCKPEPGPDPWARSNLAYAWFSYRNIWKELRKRAAERRQLR